MNREFFSRGPILVALFGSTILGGFLTSPVMAKQDHFHSSIQTALQDREFQPNMQRALSSLKEAQRSLLRATHDKGGYRVKALELVNQATKETQLGIEYDRTHSGDRRRSQDIQRSIQTAPQQNRESYQPNMQRALSSLIEAQRSLEKATPDKGGHRMKAIALVQQAIQETQQGIKYDLAHGNDQNPESQLNMQRALSSLSEAQKLLERATPDKGGHRLKALALLQQVIKETQRGIEYDRTHGND